MGNSVTAWIQSPSDLVDQPVAYNRYVYASPAEKRSAKLRKLRELAAECFKNHDFTFVSHHASVSASLAGLAESVPHVVHFQGPWSEETALEGAPRWKTFLQRRDEKKAYRSADRIITLSDAFRQIVTDRYGVSADVVRVIPGAIDAASFDPRIARQEARQRLGWPTDRPIMVSIRRLVPRVGVDVLVDAIASVVRTHSDLLLMIGGTGPLQEDLQQRIAAFGLEKNVRLLGFVPESELPLAYGAADFSVVPTQALEGFGLVVLESMATGTPALVTPVGSLPEVVRDLNESLILPGRSADEIAEGIGAVLDGQLSIPTDGECRCYVRKNFDWSVIAPRVLKVYQEAKEGK